MEPKQINDTLDRRISEARGLAGCALERIKAGGRVADIVLFERYALREQDLIARRAKQKTGHRT